jgi:hypothetical protein
MPHDAFRTRGQGRGDCIYPRVDAGGPSCPGGRRTTAPRVSRSAHSEIDKLVMSLLDFSGLTSVGRQTRMCPRLLTRSPQPGPLREDRCGPRSSPAPSGNQPSDAYGERPQESPRGWFFTSRKLRQNSAGRAPWSKAAQGYWKEFSQVSAASRTEQQAVPGRLLNVEGSRRTPTAVTCTPRACHHRRVPDETHCGPRGRGCA